MTVCVAAICDNNNSIVTASDMMLSYDSFSADLAVKAMQIHPNWQALFAGNVSACWPILREAKARSVTRENTVEQVKASCREAYGNQFQRYITHKVLVRYGFDLESFKENGLKQLGRDVFNSLCRQIDQINFDCEFLICGFDKDKNPHIFTVSNPGIATEHSPPGFYAIGSGEFSALSTLVFHRFKSGMQLARGIYHVCEAKFMAESAVGVGSPTNALIIHNSGDLELVDSRLIEEIKDAWTLEGKARVPSGIEETIKSKLAGESPTQIRHLSIFHSRSFDYWSCNAFSKVSKPPKSPVQATRSSIR